MRRALFALVAMLLGLLVAGVVAEVAARAYVYGIAEQGRLFAPHGELGWALIPDLDLVRKNPMGERWHIRTDERGHRSLEARFRPGAALRVLVVGDSFAFGEGVDLEDRFDARVAEAHPDWSIVNQGVMGYGTDQEMLAARGDIAQLQRGDVLLIVTYANDFLDLLMRSHSGRAKPWFELREGALSQHPPEIGAVEKLRDQSYLLARLFQMLDRSSHDFSEGELRTSGHLYRRIVEQETEGAIARGVRVVIAHHGNLALRGSAGATLRSASREALGRLCRTPGIDCVPLDPSLSGGRDLYQPDGHWSAKGNAVVADVIAPAIQTAAMGADR